MEKIIKIIVFVFVAVLLVSIIYIKSFSQNRTIMVESFQMNTWVDVLNNDLPRNIGSIGRLDKISLKINLFIII